MPGMQIILPMAEAGAATLSGPGSGLANLQTPSPREVWVAPGTGVQNIEIDFGADVTVDSFALVGTNALPGALWSIRQIASLGGAVTSSLLINAPMRMPGAIRKRYASFYRHAVPVTGRYFRVQVNQGAAPAMVAGRLDIGLALEIPYAFGSGRTPIDTSRVVELPDGGFGVDRGVVKTLLSWRFVDLDAVTLAKLWAIAEDRGESRPIIAIEGDTSPTQEPSFNYGLFRRFEAYEREDPASTKWGFSMVEWL